MCGDLAPRPEAATRSLPAHLEKTATRASAARAAASATPVPGAHLCDGAPLGPEVASQNSTAPAATTPRQGLGPNKPRTSKRGSETEAGTGGADARFVPPTPANRRAPPPGLWASFPAPSHEVDNHQRNCPPTRASRLGGARGWHLRTHESRPCDTPQARPGGRPHRLQRQGPRRQSAHGPGPGRFQPRGPRATPRPPRRANGPPERKGLVQRYRHRGGATAPRAKRPARAVGSQHRVLPARRLKQRSAPRAGAWHRRK